MSEQEPHSPWRQVTLWYDNWQTAENMGFTLLRPLLDEAQSDGRIARWWFIRKSESWRLRFLPADGRDETATAFLAHLTQALVDQPAVRRYTDEAIYEAETGRFGGPRAMKIAHVLFSVNSRHVLQHLARPQPEGDHRRELGVRLATRMMLAAGQDWYEQGDIWSRLAEHRDIGGEPGEPSPATLAGVQGLLTAQGEADSSPLTLAPEWPTAFEHTGRALADMAQCGQLTRGLRAVLTDHLIFAFNQLGIAAYHQHVLAIAADEVIFQRSSVSDAAPRADQTDLNHPTTVRRVTMDTTDKTTAEAHALRETLIAKIDSLGAFHTDQVKDAFRTVPRHLFLPDVDLLTAYAPKPVVTKRAEDGTALSSASSPSLVATMLEQLQVAPGHRILEIGAATGINAALLTELTGPTGTVVTIELDDDLAARARTGLATAGYNDVKVVCGDGALGHAAGAPYDRIIVTAGAWDISSAWWQQLAPGGRIVVPLRLHGSGLTRSIPFDRTADNRMQSTTAAVCGFVPMRGAAEMGERHVRLADDVILKLDADDLPDETALAQALTHRAHEHWTGVQIPQHAPAAHLDLWLATISSGASFGRLSVGPAARTLGLANPSLRWAGASLYDGGTIAYLTTRPVSDEVDELGFITHGPDSTKLTVEVKALLQGWDRSRPEQPITTAYPSETPAGHNVPGARITRPDTRLTISW